MSRRRFIYPSDGSEPFEVTQDYAPEPRVYIQGDIQPYQSMVTGEQITSRAHHREHLIKHRLFEIGNEKMTPARPSLDDRDRKRQIAEIVAAKK